MWLFEITRLPLKPGNRMWRPIAVGQHEGRWFVRTDWWAVGWRVTRQAKSKHKMDLPSGPLPPPWWR